MKNFTSLTGKGSYCTGKGSYRASGERISKCLLTSAPPGVACRRRPRGGGGEKFVCVHTFVQDLLQVV